ncbi:NADH dehydrogenase I subunit M [Escherichia coli]|uniref:NADH dehydrogenase I subunit M n=1 Tax=Escherichia coli TaxID=562 RepID=A0A376KQH7_ECOLX|nr:NADH dehydrogenase I subunit M [Escherichia coli]
MLLPWLILIPFIGGFLCWQTERFGVKVPRWDRADHHGIDAGAVAATVVAGRLFTDAIRRNSAVAV